MDEFRFQITEELEEERLDKCISMLIESLSRSFIQKMIKDETVTVNGNPAKGSYRVKCDDEVVFCLPKAVEPDILPEDIPLDILYEDTDVIVVNKPKGMVVHPAAGHYSGTLVNALLYHCKDLSGINGVMRPGIVHRIDRDTSGLLIVAKNDFAHQSLSAQLADRSLSRVYEAVVHGGFRADSGTVNAPIGRHPVDRKRMAVTEKNSRHAVTYWEVIERYAGFTHIRCKLETGRTHQIRVHMAHIGHPLLGDMVYGAGKPEKGLEGQCLHARTLKFIHPRTGEHMELTSPLPEYFTAVLARLGPPLDNQ